MCCPNCNSEDIDTTNKFDLAITSPDECRQDFECNDCEALFQIIYHAVRTMMVELPEVDE